MNAWNLIKTLVQGHKAMACKYISFNTREVLYVNHQTKSYYINRISRKYDNDPFPAPTLQKEDYNALTNQITAEYERWI